jgi:tetratricopeptide (TPR) repeat protein
MNQKSLDVIKVALAAAPLDFDLHINEAAANHFAAAALMNLGRLDEADRHESAALERLRQLLAADPKTSEFQGFVSIALTAQADIAVRRGDGRQAMVLLHEALESVEAALAAGTMHPYIRHSKGRTEALYGAAYALRGDWQNAREWYQRALASFQKISSIWSEAADDARVVAERIAECNRRLARPS